MKTYQHNCAPGDLILYLRLRQIDWIQVTLFKYITGWIAHANCQLIYYSRPKGIDNKCKTDLGKGWHISVIS